MGDDVFLFQKSSFHNNQRIYPIIPIYDSGRSRPQSVFTRHFSSSVRNSSQNNEGSQSKNRTLDKPKTNSGADKYSDTLYPEDEEEFKYWEKDRRTRLYGDTEQLKHHTDLHDYVDVVEEQVLEGLTDYKSAPSVTEEQGSESLSNTLTHTDNSGKLNMIDISTKADTDRVAVAMATIKLGEKVFNLVKQSKAKKGDVLTVAQIAGITAAKRTSELIPLCHNIPLSKINVDLDLRENSHSLVITSLAKSYGKTGVEMEAIMAATVAAVTVYDMCKAVSRDMVISEIKLVKKTGGVRGDYQLN